MKKTISMIPSSSKAPSKAPTILNTSAFRNSSLISACRGVSIWILRRIYSFWMVFSWTLPPARTWTFHNSKTSTTSTSYPLSSSINCWLTGITISRDLIFKKVWFSRSRTLSGTRRTLDGRILLLRRCSRICRKHLTAELRQGFLTCSLIYQKKPKTCIWQHILKNWIRTLRISRKLASKQICWRRV